jgi:hypothetical protein
MLLSYLTDKDSLRLIADMVKLGRPVAAVCFSLSSPKANERKETLARNFCKTPKMSEFILLDYCFTDEQPCARNTYTQVCHAPCVLVNAVDPSGAPLVKGKRVTGFSNEEEEAVGLTNVVPLLRMSSAPARIHCFLANC